MCLDLVYKHVQQRVEDRPVGPACRQRGKPSEPGKEGRGKVSRHYSHTSRGDSEQTYLAPRAQLTLVTSPEERMCSAEDGHKAPRGSSYREDIGLL